MKIICQKINLLKSVNISLKAVPSKTTMPILECILIDATTNQIKFTTNEYGTRYRNNLLMEPLKKKESLRWMQKFSMKSFVDCQTIR